MQSMRISNKRRSVTSGSLSVHEGRLRVGKRTKKATTRRMMMMMTMKVIVKVMVVVVLDFPSRVLRPEMYQLARVVIMKRIVRTNPANRPGETIPRSPVPND